MPENKRKKFRELLKQHSLNGCSLFALSVGRLPDSEIEEAVKATLEERSAIMERIARLQSEESSLRNTYPVGEVSLAMITDCRRKIRTDRRK